MISCDAAAQQTAARASQLISRRIAEFADWCGQVLRHVRRLIREAVHGMTEEWRWNTPVWPYHGIVCTGESYKAAVKLTFAKGASLRAPAGLFNSSRTARCGGQSISASETTWMNPPTRTWSGRPLP